MKKLSLPKINITNKNSSLPKKKHLFTNPFSSLLKKYKLKKHNYNSQDSKDNSGKYLLTEPYRGANKKMNDTIKSFLQKEENKILINGQKHLIKLYRNDYSSLIDSMKKEVQLNRIKLSKMKEKNLNKPLPPLLEYSPSFDIEKVEEYENENETLT